MVIAPDGGSGYLDETYDDAWLRGKSMRALWDDPLQFVEVRDAMHGEDVRSPSPDAEPDHLVQHVQGALALGRNPAGGIEEPTRLGPDGRPLELADLVPEVLQEPRQGGDVVAQHLIVPSSLGDRLRWLSSCRPMRGTKQPGRTPVAVAGRRLAIHAPNQRMATRAMPAARVGTLIGYPSRS